MEWYLQPGQPVAPLRREIGRYFEPYASTDALGAIVVIVGELLANIVSHTDGGASIHADWNDGSATLTVVDAGPGYATDEISRPDAASEHGFGLWLVKQLSNSVRVIRGPRGGTTVTVELPLK